MNQQGHKVYMCVNDTGALRESCGAAEASVRRSGLQRGGSEEREPRRARHIHPGNSTGKRGSLVRENENAAAPEYAVQLVRHYVLL